MMNHIDRRDALALFGLTIGADAAFGSVLAQADITTATSPATSSAVNIEPAPHVSGDYQAVYQEGYAQAFLELGFPEEFLLQMFSEATDNLTIIATTKAVFLRQRQLEPSGKSRLGTKLSERHARFDQPNRLVISFTAPNGKRVDAVQTFYANGYVTVLSIEGAPHLRPVRNVRPTRSRPAGKLRSPSHFEDRFTYSVTARCPASVPCGLADDTAHNVCFAPEADIQLDAVEVAFAPFSDIRGLSHRSSKADIGANQTTASSQLPSVHFASNADVQPMTGASTLAPSPGIGPPSFGNRYLLLLIISDRLNFRVLSILR